MARPTILFISQVYLPDPAAVGQHLAGAASELARRGNRVVILTSARGYDDPAKRYMRREVLDGVEVRRVGLASFGKDTISIRVLAGLSFITQAIVHGFALRGVHTIVVSTSPPMAAIAALLLGWWRKVQVKYWIMDVNPDEAIAMGVVGADSFLARAMDWLNRRILSRADDVIVLDRFMAELVARKLPAVRQRLTVLPPWPLDDVSKPLPHADNPFRTEHGLTGKFVVMYSGNHSPTNPLATLLAAAERLQDDSNLVFLFVGGGLGKRQVEASGARGILSLGYQPISALRQSLSCADLHVVTIGDTMVGIIHPCKVYGAMAAARPVLMFGPSQNHVSDILEGERIGRQVAHGDVDGAVAAIREFQLMAPEELREMGLRAQAAITRQFSRGVLLNSLCDVLERGTRPAIGNSVELH